MKKYEQGSQIKSITVFENMLNNNKLIYIRPWKRNVHHPIILANMPYRIVKKFIERGMVYKAKKIR